MVLDKPPGVVVHPAPGHPTGTLVHGILKHCTDLSGIGGVARPGIVHRLDKNTSGLMVVAKRDFIHASLAAQFKAGDVKKEYLALVHGRVIPATGQIDLPIGRHPVRRKEMAVRPSGGKSALTLWTTLRHYGSGFSLLSVTIRTGRTHQIRVHLSHLGYPVVGDPVYGRGKKGWKRFPPFQEGFLPNTERQMLHARRLGFKHPEQGSDVEFEAPLPEDMKMLLHRLESWEFGREFNKNLDMDKKSVIVSDDSVFSCLSEDPV
jgi:23S rRNA pseudouridine1911/1915/1917 synthase